MVIIFEGSENTYGILNDFVFDDNTLWFYVDGENIISICQGYDYPLPEVRTFVYEDVTFTFTPIPVYK